MKSIRIVLLLFIGSMAAHAGVPKEIAKQIEADWRDGRYAKVAFGPFVSGHIATPRGSTHKGIAIRMGDKNEGTMVFDTDLCIWRAGWTGGFLKTDPARYGLIRALQPVGVMLFSNSPLPGVSGRNLLLVDPRNPRHGPLPKGWARYSGLKVNGSRVVMQYSVGRTRVLDSPWLISGQGMGVMVRDLQIEEHVGQLILRVCEEKAGKWWEEASDFDLEADPISSMIYNKNNNDVLAIAAVGPAQLDFSKAGQVLLRVGTEERLSRVKLFTWRGPAVRMPAFKEMVRKHKTLVDVVALSKPGPRRWGEPLVTKGIVEKRKTAFVIDTITVPYKNRHNALFFTAGHDFGSNGDCYVATAHGDVWKVTGIDAELKAVKWHRFATGLYQPLGLRVVKDQVYVLGRDQITRLHDKNGDGEADFYEAFNNDIIIGGGGHSYATCLETDPKGNFYFIRCAEGTPHGGVVLKVAADGSKLEVVATGFRNPNGLGVGPNGVITAADQQGTWVPETRLDVIRTGGFYGYMPMHKRKVSPKTYDPPLVWVPRVLDNSAGGQVWVPKGKWGPLGGELLHFSYGRCTMMHIVRDGANGGVVPLGGRFLSGACRGRFNLKDGHLYVSGLLGWQTSAIRDGCLQRVRYTGEPIRQPIGMEIHANGIRLTFSTPLDKKIAEDAESWSAEQWNYRWTAAYGSKDWSVKNPNKQGRDSVEIKSAKLLPEGRSVFLQMSKVRAVHSMGIRYNLDDADGKIFKGIYYLTINKIGRKFE